MSLVTINGVAVATPSSYTWNIMDISNAERNAKGSIIIERIATKRKIELGWNYLTRTEMATLLQSVSNTTFPVTFVDAQTNSNVTKTMYVGDRNVGMIDFQNGVARYKDIKFNLIEV